MATLLAPRIRSIITNPAFANPGGFEIRRPTKYIDDDGMVSRMVQTIHAEGVIYPSGNLGNTEEPVTERQQAVITVISDTPILTGDIDDATTADIVVWHGNEYLVNARDDYSNHGFNVVNAVMISAGGLNA